MSNNRRLNKTSTVNNPQPITFVTRHRDFRAQYEVITLLTARGCTCTFVNYVKHETHFTTPQSQSEAIKKYINSVLIEFNNTIVTKTRIAKNSVMEYKYCKIFQGACDRCGLSQVYCSRRSFISIVDEKSEVK